MAKIVPVSKERHANKCWQKTTDVFSAAQVSMVPLVARELPMAALRMPTAFALMDGRYTLVALFSIISGQNLYVSSEGNWLTDYMPAALKSPPFYMVKKEGSPEVVFCVDEDSKLIGDQGEPLFDQNGDLSEPVRGMFEFLKQMEQNRAGTEHAVSALSDAGLIIPWELKAVSGEQSNDVKGIFRIDEEKLNQVGDETFLHLRKVHALPIAYSQLLSMGNLRVLQALVKRHEQKPAAQDMDIGGFTLRT